MKTFLTIIVPLISVVLAILPFWYIRKKKGVACIKKQHILTAFIIALVLVILFQFSVSNLTDWAFNNLDNYDPVIDGIDFGLIFSWFVLILLASASPLLLIRYLHKKITWKNTLLAIVLGLIILIILGAILLNFMAWGVGAAFSNLN